MDANASRIRATLLHPRTRKVSNSLVSTYCMTRVDTPIPVLRLASLSRLALAIFSSVRYFLLVSSFNASSPCSRYRLKNPWAWAE